MSLPLATSLAGLRVLDASRVLAGPYAGQILADLGADVIKVESPRGGDETRGWGPPFLGELSAYYLACNRGKRGIALDLKQPAGRAVFGRLACASDIVLTNVRADSAEALGLTAAHLHALNPRLIVCTISGYGANGPWASRPGYDFVVQGMSGMMAATGPAAGPPSKVGVAVCDITAGLYAAVAVLAAVHGRGAGGQGYAIDLALLDCAVATMANVAQSYLTSGVVPARQGNAHQQIVPYELFQTQDSWLVLAVGNDGQWRRFCAAAGASGLDADQRYATNQGRVLHRAELVPQVAALLRVRRSAEWQESLDQAGVPCGPVLDLAQLFASDAARERGLKMTVRRADGTPVDLVGSPLTKTLRPDAAPPALGEHTRRVLQEILGVSDGELATLARDGVI